MFPSPSSWRIVRGDIVQVVTGKDKGQQGEVMRVIRDQRFPRVYVQGLNKITRRIPERTLVTGQTAPGYSVQMEAPLHYSNVMLVDPISKKPVRTYFMFEDQPPYRRVRKTRGKHATNSVIPWPDKWKQDLKQPAHPGDKDTKIADVDEVTYDPATDFTMQLPSAHEQLRRAKAQREAVAAEKKAAQQQLWRKYRPLLFSSRAAGAAGSSEGSSTSGDSAASSSGVRSYSSSCEAASSSAECAPVAAGSAAGSLLMLQRSMLCTSSRGRLLACAGLQQQLHRLNWCGLAAAPLLL